MPPKQRSYIAESYRVKPVRSASLLFVADKPAPGFQYFDKQADSVADEDALRDQEQALIKLGALYRDHKYV